MSSDFGGQFAPLLCLFHFIATPFFGFIRNYPLYVFAYIGFTVVIVVGEVYCLMHLPDGLGFDGFGYLYFIAIPVVVAFVALSIRTVMYLVQVSRQRRREAHSDIAAATVAPSQAPTPASRRADAFSDSFGIVMISILAAPILNMLFHFSYSPEPSLVRLAVCIAFAECVWQLWTRRVSRPGGILHKQPWKYHIAVIAAVFLIILTLEITPFLDMLLG